MIPNNFKAVGKGHVDKCQQALSQPNTLECGLSHSAADLCSAAHFATSV